MANQIVLILCRDLMFSSKISAAARAAGVGVKIIREPAQLAGQEGERLFVDLGQEGALEAAARWKSAAGRPVVGFVSHTDTQTIEQARAAGLDQVLSRGAFTQMLPELIGPRSEE